MADPVDPNEPQSPQTSGTPETPDIYVPIEGEEKPESPRRAASARFVVESEVGSHAAMREAMDPANQSLADALRLSFRVLQVVIGVLVVLFLLSGWKQVKDDQTGVLSVWGKIVDVGGAKELEPGLRWSKWPYPAGEFLLFQRENRTVVIDEEFWPKLAPNMTLEEATAGATLFDRLKPGRDGSVIVQGGDLAHLQLSGTFRVVFPVDYVEAMDDADAERVVQLALQRAVVHTGARIDLEELIGRDASVAAEVEKSAQDVLDELESGVELTSVSLPRTTAVLAIRKTLEDQQKADIDRQQTLVRAREDATGTLTSMAGSDYRGLVNVIADYEAALQAGDATLAGERLVAVSTQLDDSSGEVAMIVQRARNYTSEVEASLGRDARRFTSLLTQYRESPHRLVKRLWFETYARVLAMEDAEIYFVPASMENIQISLTGLDEVQQIRLKSSLERREREHVMEFAGGLAQRRFRAGDIQLSGPGRQLEIDPETNQVVPKGRRR
jgi:regulator of protease activity HflC (stomatin/prohibitin superfamily)